MSSYLPRTNISPAARAAQATRDKTPRRLIVTAGVVAFAIRDWSLWVLLRTGPWGPPMRLVLGSEAVAEAVDRTLDALLLWAEHAPFVSLKSGWQEQQVQVWGSEEQGTSVSLIHSILLRAHRDRLRANLHTQPVPSLHVAWVPVAEIEAERYRIDENVRPGVLSALHSLRANIQHEPEIILRYLADMGTMPTVPKNEPEWRQQEKRESVQTTHTRTTLPLGLIPEPVAGDGTLTLAEASLLYNAFFSSDEQLDLSTLRRRFLSTNTLEALEQERSVRGRELERRRISRVYRYHTKKIADESR